MGAKAAILAMLVGCGPRDAVADSGLADGGSSEATSSEATSGSAAGETGQSDGADAAGACEPKFAAIRKSILGPRCAIDGCHGDGGQAAAGLVLTGNESAVVERLSHAPSGCDDAWVILAPGDADASLLVAKLDAPPPCGVSMPVGEALSSEEIGCMRQWVDGLAGPDCETCGGDACVSLDDDPNNCGACGNACDASVACFDGSCACPAGTTDCGSGCVAHDSNPNHCGACGTVCGAQEVCNAGRCSSGCGALSKCGAACVDLETDAQHCGGCDSACASGSSCEAGSCSCAGPVVTYTADIEPVFVSECASSGCHAGGQPKANLDLRPGAGYADLVGVESEQCSGSLRVAPGAADDSYLVNKLTGSQLCAGTRMPKTGPSLTPAQLDAVRSWICRGAPP